MNTQFENSKLGYGNPNGDYWFVGPEEGGSIASIALRMKIWEELKAEHYADIYEFHKLFGNGTLRFFDKPVKLQGTWAGLIEILIAMRAEEYSINRKREIQSTEFGRDTSNTCVVELLPYSSKSLTDLNWDSHNKESKVDYIKRIKAMRIILLVNQLIKYQPKVVLFYSKAYLNEWIEIINKVVGTNVTFFQHPSLPIHYYKNRNTLFVITDHPVSISMNSIKTLIGNTINSLLA